MVITTAEFLFTDFKAPATSVAVTTSKASERSCSGVKKSLLIYGRGANGSGNKNGEVFHIFLQSQMSHLVQW
jgi:hypothetical protein